MVTTTAAIHARAAAEMRFRVRPDDDGALCLVFVSAAGEVVLSLVVEEGLHCPDELFRRHLVEVIRPVIAARAVLVACRPSGRPTRTDQALWRDLRRRLAADWPHRLDLLVVGTDGLWAPRICRTA